jgi:hypothetical protein
MDKLTALSYSDGRSSSFTRNFSNFIHDYRALHVRRRYFSKFDVVGVHDFVYSMQASQIPLMNAAQIISIGENTRRTEIRAKPQGLQTSIRFTYMFSSKHMSDIGESSFNSVLNQCLSDSRQLQPI